MEKYYPILITNREDDNVDYVVMVNKDITPDQFTACVDKAIEQLKEEGYDYDENYWGAICEKLPKWLDFATYDYPNQLYY